jgi:hypothetical protein
MNAAAWAIKAAGKDKSQQAKLAKTYCNFWWC